MSAFEEFAKISLPKKIAGLLIFLGLIGLVYYFARYQSLAGEVSSLQRHHNDLENEERRLKAKQASYLEDVERLEQKREQFAAQSQILPPDPEISTFLKSLNDNAELAGLEISLVQPMDEEVVDFYSKIPVELKLRGRYHELAKFFYNVGRLKRIINIENISLGIDDKTSSNEEELSEERGLLIDAQVLATTFRAVDTESDQSANTKQGGG